MESYDIFLSIGPACRPAWHLRAHNLRQFAAPLDWQDGYSLDTVIQLFKTSFSSFFRDITVDGEFVRGDECNRRVIDTTNHIVSTHYFPQNIPIDDCQKEFIANMQRRYTNIDKKLKASDTLMLIGNRENDITELQDFLRGFSNLYPNLHITLVNMRDDSSMDDTSVHTKEYALSDKLTVIEHIFNDLSDSNKPEDRMGNDEVWSSILGNYCLADSTINANIKNAFEKLKEKLEGRNAVIYGAGLACLGLLRKLSEYDIQAKGIAVSNGRKRFSELKNLPISMIENYSCDDVILIAVRNRQSSYEIKNMLLSKGYNNIVAFDHGTVPNIEDVQKIR